MLFRNLGDLRLQSGIFRVIKTINLTEIDLQISLIDQEIGELIRACNNDKEFCITIKSSSNDFNSGLRKLKYDLNTAYSLLGSQRQIRGINFIGTGLKYLFGVMDNDDEVYIQRTLQDVVNQEDKLHNSMSNMIHVMKEVSK